MKTINQYITEKLVIGDNLDKGYNYYPETKEDLIKYIKEKILKEGIGNKDNPLNLNDIDTSKITDMSNLFAYNFNKHSIVTDLSSNGVFNISNWNVSNVEDMSYMFYGSSFDGDLSEWNVSKVKNMDHMFAISKFTGENTDISSWDISNVKNICKMFWRSKFSGNISSWDISNVNNMNYMLEGCPLEKNPPKWYYA